MTNGDDDTVEFYADFEPEDPVIAESFDELGIKLGAVTHRGMVRRTNEDQYAILRRSRASTVLASSLPVAEFPTGQEHAWLLAVADGLGGQVSGEIASATAMRAILDFANGLNNWIMRRTESLQDDFKERVELYALLRHRWGPGQHGLASS